MKKILIILIVLLSVGCGSAPKTPESAVSGFLDATKSFNYKKMSSYINPTSEESVELMNGIEESYENDELENELLSYFKENAKKIKYTTDETVEDGNKATVTVSVDYVDGGPYLEAVLQEYVGQMFALAFAGEEPSEEEAIETLRSIMNDKKKEIETTMISKTFDVEVVKLNDEWLIDDLNQDLHNVIISNFVFSFGEFE